MKSTLEYKLDKSLLVVAVFVRELVNVLVMYLILSRFVSISGWDMNEMFFLYSFLFLSYSLCVFFFTGIRDFSFLVISGDFDRFLVRPLGLIYQVICSGVDYPAFIGHGLVGVIIFLKSASSVGIIWNLQTVFYCVIILVAGAIIQASVLLIFSSFSFWAINTTNLRNLFYFNCRRFAGYPISFYPGFIQKILIYIIPFAFVNYFPTIFLLGKPEAAQYWGGFLYLAPLVSLSLLAASVLLWKLGLKNYHSTGN